MTDTFHIQWHVTNFCNLRCIHCYQDDFTPGEDLLLSDLKKIFENITSFLRGRELSLVLDITGGEPFLYREWEKLLDYIYSSSSVEKDRKSVV